MLTLTRKEGQWAEVVHRSGDILRVRVRSVTFADDGSPRVRLDFDDPKGSGVPGDFEVNRPEDSTPSPAPEATR